MEPCSNIILTDCHHKKSFQVSLYSTDTFHDGLVAMVACDEDQFKPSRYREDNNYTAVISNAGNGRTYIYLNVEVFRDRHHPGCYLLKSDMDPKPLNRRAHYRYKMKYDGMMYEPVSREDAPIFVDNKSEGGMMFITDSSVYMPLDTMVEVSFYNRRERKEEFHRCQVVRMTNKEDTIEYGCRICK